jgi:radical SAM/Cys-rich protein
VTLRADGHPLHTPIAQRHRLDQVGALPFEEALHRAGWEDGLTPLQPRVLQLNLGRRCNLQCRHCHVDAGPDRDEVMSDTVVDAALTWVARGVFPVVDLTGGAPELHPRFREIVAHAAAHGCHVIDRCNLTILRTSRHADLPQFFAAHGVEVVASLPHWRRPNTDRQRGDGVYDASIAALHALNQAGYGSGDPRRVLTLVHNPIGAFLPAGEAAMDRAWKAGLKREHGVHFDRLIALTNLPVSRFLADLDARDDVERYLTLLVESFNAATVSGLMCRDTWSVGWDGTLYDCDFHQMLDQPMDTPKPTLAQADLDAIAMRRVVPAQHCYGCTAGAGSSCGGALT